MTPSPPTTRRQRYNAGLLTAGICVRCAKRPRAVAANGGVLQQCETCRKEILDRNNARAERNRKARAAAKELAMAALRSSDAYVAELAGRYFEVCDAK